MAQSLTKSSASLVAAGGDLAEAAALTATANAIIQDADSVGTALKTTSLRLRGTSVEVLEEEGLDSDGVIESTSKLRSQVMAISGVDILTDSGAYKSTYQILLEIAEVWDQITDDKARAGLLELLAGKRNSSVIAALLQNPEDLKAAYEDAMNAEGSALKENEKYLDSIQGKIDQFNNAMQSMWSNALNSDFIKWIVEIGTGLVKIIDKFGLFTTAVFGFFTYLSHRKNGQLDLASVLGIHDKENGWTFGQEGLTGKIKGLFEKKNITKDILGDPADVEVDVKEYAEAISDNITDYVKVDTSQIDTQIEDIQNKLMIAREQLDDAKSTGWDYYKSMGSMSPAQDRDNRIVEKQQEITSLEGQLSELQTKRSNMMSDAALKYAEANVSAINAETQAQRSMLEVLTKVKGVKLSMGNEQDAAIKIDQINAAAAQGEVALSQYAATLGDSDIALQAYITSLNGGKASLSGFNQFIQQHNAGIKASGVAAKAAAIGHSILNAAISMGISLLISGAISAISSWINSVEEAAEAAREAIDTYETANDTLRSHKKTLDSIKEDYGKLVDGVDELGNNVSLTTEEYERYNEITNQIADMFPHLIAGYTAEGNAILTVKGNVEALTEAYEAEARAARQALLLESNDIVKSNYNIAGERGSKSKNTIDNMSQGWKNLGEGFSLGIWQAEADNFNFRDLKKYLDGDESALHGAAADQTARSRILKSLEVAGADVSYLEIATGSKDALDRIIKENREIVDSFVNRLNAETGKAASDNRSLIDAYLGENDKFKGLDDNTKLMISKVVKNLDDEFVAAFKNNETLFAFVESGLIGSISSLSEDAQNQIQLGFDLTTKLNNGEVTIGEYETQIQSIITLIDALDLENEDEILKSFRLIFNIDESGKVENAKQNVVKNILQDQYDDQVVNLTQGDLDIVDKNLTSWEIPDGTLLSWDELQEKIAESKALAWSAGAEFEKVSDGIDSIQDAYNSLSDAVEQYNSSGYLTLDSLQSILSLEPEYLALLQMENGQLSINQAAAEAMIQVKLAEAEANAIQSAMTQLETLAKEAATKATNDNATAATNAIESLGNYSSALGTVAQDAIVAAGAVSALNNAVDGAKEAGVSEEDINTVMSNLDTYLSLINTTRQNLSTSFVPIVTGGEGGNPEKEHNDDVIGEGWEKLVSEYENKLALITNERDLIEAEIDKMEARDGKASARYYEDLIRGSEEEKALLIQKKAALEEYLAANADSIDQDTWTDYNNEINATAVAIKECKVNTVEFAEAIREIDLHYFEQINDELGRLGEELEFVDSLLSDEEVADENGNWSSAALTRMAMYTNQLELSAANAARYQDKIDELNDAYANGERSEEQYQEELANLVSEQQGAIQSYEDAKDSIVQLNEARIDAIKEGIEKEIEAYEDLISAKQEELDAERDLHDFRKSTEKQTKNIAELERRIAALSGSSAQSDVAERRKLEAQLVEAKGELNDSYYDHSRDAMSAALDDENEAYAQSKERYIERLEEQLKDQETLIQNSIMDVMINADTVYNELNALADTYGVVLSEELTQPWKDASAQAIAWKDELKESMTSGEYAALIGEGGAVTAFANGVANKLKGSWSSAKTAAENYAGYLTGTELKNKFTSTITGFGNQIQSIIDKWNGVKKAADDAYAAQTRVANVGGTGTGGGDTGNDYSPSPAKETPKTPTMNASGKNSSHIRVGKKTDALSKNKKTVGGVEYYLWSDGYYYPMSAFRVVTTDVDERGKKSSVFGFPAGTTRYKYYAKGTTGTDRDQWAITDEPQFGDELVLVPTAQGNLSYMRKGTGVVPADLTANLMEWGQFTPDSMNLGGGVNINIINNAVVKPEFNLDIENFLRCDNVSQDALPELKKFVKEQMDSLVKQMNYSVKRYAR